MSKSKIFDEMPDNPEDAFLYLEEKFRDTCEERVSNAQEHESTNVHYVQYISKVLGAIEALELDNAFKGRTLPSITDVDYQYYLNFSNDVEHYVTSLQIRRSRWRKGQLVPFDHAAKTKLHKYLSDMKNVVAALDISVEKKEAITNRINELAGEIDRDRTGLEKFGALIVASGAISGEALEKSKLMPLLHAVARVIWGKQNEVRQLPSPPKRLEHKPSSEASPEVPPNLDDDIPF